MPDRAWRLVIAASALNGVVLAAHRYDVWWTALSQLANLAVGVAFVALAFREPRSPWLRGALASTMLLVALAYLPMANGNFLQPWSVLEHVVTPALVVTDYVARGDNLHRVRWWYPVSWLAAPAAYLVWYVDADLDVYAALDPNRPESFVWRVAALLAVLLVAGFGCYGTGVRRRRGTLAP
jgi:hypothetical protein